MEDCKHILQVTYSLKAAGIETFAVNLYKAIDKSRLQFDFVSYYDRNCKEFYDDVVRQMGGTVYKLGFAERRKILNNIRIRFRLYKCIKANNYKIVHVHGSSGIAVLEVIIAKLAGAGRIIIHSHSSNVANNAGFGRLQKLFTFLAKPFWGVFCSDFFACSDKAAEWLYSKKQRKKTIIIPNGIFTEAFLPDKNNYHTWRQQYGIADDVPLIGHVGSFTAPKNHPYIVKIFEAVRALDPAARFVLVGNGPYRSEIEKKVMHGNLSGCVIFTGISNKAAEWINACNVLILPSYYEGLPVVCVEAQYTGTPIIVSDVVTRDVAISDDIYYLDIKESPSVWAEKILSLKKEFRRTVKSDNFNIKSTAAKLEAFYLRS